MDKQEQDSPTIHWRINEWFPDLSPDIRARLKTYHDELIKWSRTVNLVSAKTIFVSDAIYFADSVLSSKIILGANPNLNKIYNPGAGPGFPGLIMALLFPRVQVILLEVDPKKIEFLNHIIKLLNLKNATVENKSFETLPEGSAQYAMARGFASISKTIFIARKPMPKGGVFFHLKGEEWGIEVGEIPTQLCSIWSPSLVGDYKLPIGTVRFSVVKTDKIA